MCIALLAHVFGTESNRLLFPSVEGCPQGGVVLHLAGCRHPADVRDPVVALATTCVIGEQVLHSQNWIPACAGMTIGKQNRLSGPMGAKVH